MHTIEGMTDAYNRLLEATIQHLEGLAARGVRFVSVSPDALRRLSQIPPVSKARPLPGFAAGDLRREPARAVVVSASPAAGTNAVLPTSAPKPPIPPALPVVTGLSLEAKAAQFAQLRERVLACASCRRKDRSGSRSPRRHRCGRQPKDSCDTNPVVTRREVTYSIFS
jgi:hypothetical protein